MKRIKVYAISDPSHGWYRVPKSVLGQLGIADQISRYSYETKSHAYLEEDRDMSLFEQACKAQGYDLDFMPCKRMRGNDKPSHVRRYSRYGEYQIESVNLYNL